MPAPSTPVLENFGGPASTLFGGPWGQLVVAGTPSIRRTGSDQGAADLSVPTNSENRWLYLFGRDEEAYVTVDTKPVNGSYISLFARVSGQDGTGYEAEIDVGAGTDVCHVYKFSDSSTFTELTPSVSQELTDGDTVLMQVVGSTITLTLRSSGGDWPASPVISRTDTTYANAGYIGIQVNDSTVRFSAFGGGEITPPASFTWPAF